MLQSEKASLRNFLIIYPNITTNFIPEKALWFIDGLAVVQSLKSKDTYGEWIESLIRFIIPPEVRECLLVGDKTGKNTEGIKPRIRYVCDPSKSFIYCTSRYGKDKSNMPMFGDTKRFNQNP